MKLTLSESMDLSRKLAARVVAQAAEIRQLRAFIAAQPMFAAERNSQAKRAVEIGDLTLRVAQLERTTDVLNRWRNTCVGRQSGQSRK